ncbi:hypothetical protein J6590_049408 [Homalodisca vitripennis]|nr:hypothetical protein J6590_049408 [Homalodisca vitripennis]
MAPPPAPYAWTYCLSSIDVHSYGASSHVAQRRRWAALRGRLREQSRLPRLVLGGLQPRASHHINNADRTRRSVLRGVIHHDK